MSESEMVNRHIDIEIPRDTDNVIGTRAYLRGVTKKSVIREALNEYVRHHTVDVEKLLKRQRVPREVKGE
jgi:hypothetical protein